MRICVWVACVFVAGCATVTGTQADCFRANARFTDAAACMRSEMNTLKWGSNAPLSMLADYESYLNTTEAQVRRGELSDERAKQRMQEYLVQLRNSYR